MTRLLTLLAGLCLWPVLAQAGDPVAPPMCPPEAAAQSGRPLAAIVPGETTKAEVRARLGPPSRIVQFDDCGDAMPDEALETWEYPGMDSGGAYRVHVEFDDHGIVHLIARIPDDSHAATTAKTAPSRAMKDMTM
jgi:hypothetical protein